VKIASVKDFTPASPAVGLSLN